MGRQLNQLSNVQTKIRTDRQRQVRLAVIVVLAVLALVTFCSSIYVTAKRPMSPLEASLFNILLLIFSSVFAFLTARRDEESTIFATQEKLGASALRRIDDLTASCQRLSAYLEARIPTLEDTDPLDRFLIAEQFESIGCLVAEVQSALESAAEDWRRILPEEFRKRAVARGEIVEAYSNALEEMSGAIESTRTTLSQMANVGDQRAAQQTVQIGLLQEQLQTIEKRLSAKMEHIRSEAGHVLPSVIVPPKPKTKKVDLPEMPIPKFILSCAQDPVTLDEVVTYVIRQHSVPKPSAATVRSYVKDLLTAGLLKQGAENSKLCVTAEKLSRESRPGTGATSVEQQLLAVEPKAGA